MVREVAEETGLAVRVLRHVGTVHRDAGVDGRFVIRDFLCAVVGEGPVVAGDDAAEARFVTAAELAGLPLVPGLLDALRDWNLLPR